MIVSHQFFSGQLLVIEHRCRWHSVDYWKVPRSHGPVHVIARSNVTRGQARACRMDASRRKRRRFVQRLRKGATR
jgi:hypothetical protein